MKAILTLLLFILYASRLSAQSDCAVSLGAGGVENGTKNSYACAVMQDGTVWCWGINNYGQLGNGTLTDSDIPVQVSGITNAIKVSGGLHHTAALLSDGTVKSWGKNDKGQLGDGSTNNSLIPVSVPSISNAIDIVTGDHHTAVLLPDGTVKGWGWNQQGQLGNGANSSINTTPVQAIGISTAIKISARFRSTYVILKDSTIRCWGENLAGQLGNSTNVNSSLPATVVGITTAIFIDAGDHHAMAILADGSIRAWGRNVEGQLGNGNNTNTNLPVTVTGINNAKTITGGDIHACALLSDGSIKCWGRNTGGELGNGASGTQSNVPVSVLNISNAVEIVCGGMSSYALLADGTVKSWGHDSTGTLGNGPPRINSSTPVQVSGILCTKTAINELITGNPSRLDIYPNPGNGIFTIASGTTMESITLFNVMGEKVYEKKTNQTSINIDLSEYTQGIYITTVKYNNGFIQNARLLLLNN